MVNDWIPLTSFSMTVLEAAALLFGVEFCIVLKLTW